MATRAIVISTANTAVEALLTSTRRNSRSGGIQPIASDVMSIRERIVAPLANARPPPASISPNCR